LHPGGHFAFLRTACGGPDEHDSQRRLAPYADDDPIPNTTISFPIAFRNAILDGAEGKLDLSDWRRFSGFLSYSSKVGNVRFPVTGGLFPRDSACAALAQLSGHVSDSQDQHIAVRGLLFIA
jgi:hypothetical protein